MKRNERGLLLASKVLQRLANGQGSALRSFVRSFTSDRCVSWCIILIVALCGSAIDSKESWLQPLAEWSTAAENKVGAFLVSLVEPIDPESWRASRALTVYASRAEAIQSLDVSFAQFESSALNELSEASLSKYYALEYDGLLRVPISGALGYVMAELPGLLNSGALRGSGASIQSHSLVGMFGSLLMLNSTLAALVVVLKNEPDDEVRRIAGDAITVVAECRAASSKDNLSSSSSSSATSTSTSSTTSSPLSSAMRAASGREVLKLISKMDLCSPKSFGSWIMRSYCRFTCVPFYNAAFGSLLDDMIMSDIGIDVRHETLSLVLFLSLDRLTDSLIR